MISGMWPALICGGMFSPGELLNGGNDSGALGCTTTPFSSTCKPRCAALCRDIGFTAVTDAAGGLLLLLTLTVLLTGCAMTPL